MQVKSNAAKPGSPGFQFAEFLEKIRVHRSLGSSHNAPRSESLRTSSPNVQLVLLEEAADAVKGALDGHGNRRYLDTGVGAKDRDGFVALFRRDRQDGVEHERGDHGAVLAP